MIFRHGNSCRLSSIYSFVAILRFYVGMKRTTANEATDGVAWPPTMLDRMTQLTKQLVRVVVRCTSTPDGLTIRRFEQDSLETLGAVEEEVMGVAALGDRFGARGSSGVGSRSQCPCLSLSAVLLSCRLFPADDIVHFRSRRDASIGQILPIDDS